VKPALLTVHDVGYNDIAALSEPTARRFAQQFDLEPLIERHEGIFELPYLEKVKRTLRELEAGREFIVYADTDINFAAHPYPADFLTKYWNYPFSLSWDVGGFCTAFYTVRNCPETLRLFRIWAALGYHDDHVLKEQTTLKLLTDNFAWVRHLLERIPESYVSNPDCKLKGTIAHHFWARACGHGADRQAMLLHMARDFG
jgi:hypothetical protein